MRKPRPYTIRCLYCIWQNTATSYESASKTREHHVEVTHTAPYLRGRQWALQRAKTAKVKTR